MSTVQRYDRGSLKRDALERTPQGGIRVPAALTRSGCAPYSDGKSSWVEYRPPEEVANAESLATLQSAPVTDDHPSVDVSAENWASLSKGLVEGVPRYDEASGLVLASVLVQDAKEVDLVASGERVEISCGYQCDVDPTPGVSPEGEQYDRVQRRIRYNHVALGPRGWGRMGPEVGLRLDGAAVRVVDAVPEKQTETEKMGIKIRGREYKLDAEGVQQAQAAVEDLTKKADTDAEMLSAVKAALEQALAKVKELEAKMGGMVSPDQVQAEVAALDSARSDSRTILGEDFAYRGKTRTEIQRAALEKAFPGKRFDSSSSDVISELFSLAVELHQRADSKTKVAGVREAIESARADSHDEETPVQKGHRLTRERYENAFKR